MSSQMEHHIPDDNPVEPVGDEPQEKAGTTRSDERRPQPQKPARAEPDRRSDELRDGGR